MTLFMLLQFYKEGKCLTSNLAHEYEKTSNKYSYPVCTGGVSPVINVEVIVTVHVKPLELQEELLEDGLSLEGDNAVLIPLVPALQHHPVHCPWDVGHKVSLLVLATNLPN